MRRNPATGGTPGRKKVIEGLTLGDDYDESNIPEPPAGLGEDGVNAWNRIWGNAKHLNGSDHLIVSELCFLIDETNFMRRQLSLGPAGGGVSRTYQQGKNGSIVIHPFVNQIKDNRAMIMSWLGHLGFGVLERGALVEDNDPIAQFQQASNTLKTDIMEAIREAKQ